MIEPIKHPPVIKDGGILIKKKEDGEDSPVKVTYIEVSCQPIKPQTCDDCDKKLNVVV